MDVKTNFLSGLTEEGYLKQQRGFKEHSRDTHVQFELLKKVLYALMHVPHVMVTIFLLATNFWLL